MSIYKTENTTITSSDENFELYKHCSKEEAVNAFLDCIESDYDDDFDGYGFLSDLEFMSDETAEDCFIAFPSDETGHSNIVCAADVKSHVFDHNADNTDMQSNNEKTTSSGDDLSLASIVLKAKNENIVTSVNNCTVIVYNSSRFDEAGREVMLKNIDQLKKLNTTKEDSKLSSQKETTKSRSKKQCRLSAFAKQHLCRYKQNNCTLPRFVRSKSKRAKKSKLSTKVPTISFHGNVKPVELHIDSFSTSLSDNLDDYVTLSSPLDNACFIPSICKVDLTRQAV